jgi:hypothetical protein
VAISEKQLETWSHQGSVTQSKQTYASVKSVLDDSSAPYSGRSYSNFLQGSYGNDTNIYADSDVDVVMMLDDVFYTDLNHLSEDDKNRYLSARTSASYTFSQFKAEVIAQLVSKYGSSVTPGKKAILVEGSGGRRDCDVLVCTQLRRYIHFNSFSDQSYHTGICFWTTDGTQIINFPKQHSANCTNKHKNTNSWFKPSVRILKNMRNSMVEKGYINDGLAPSYFLEGMLYNVPDENFGVSYQDTIVNSINWLRKADKSKLVCANELYFLCHPSSLVTWRAERLQAYLDAAVKFWNDWSG